MDVCGQKKLESVKDLSRINGTHVTYISVQILLTLDLLFFPKYAGFGLRTWALQ